MAIPAGTTFHGLSPLVETKNRGSAQSNSLRNAYAIEDFKPSEASVENDNVSGTYEIDLNIANHELVIVADTILSTINEPAIGQSVVVTLYVYAENNANLFQPPGGYNNYGVPFDTTGLRNQLVLSVSNNLESELVYDFSTSVQI